MNESLRDPVLYVGNIDEDINLSLPPASGEEYLKRVILEARQCKEVVYAKIDDNLLGSSTLNIKPLPECEKAPVTIRPTIEWQNYQVTNFSNTRLYMSRIRSKVKLKNNLRDKLPNSDDQTSWIKVFTNIDKNQGPCIEPTLSVILSMNQPIIEQILEYLKEFLEEKKVVEYKLGQWLYALMAALELPLKPEMCSCLRSLARICSTIRSQLNSENPNDAASLNLFICLVSRYFRQLDLADD